MIPNITISFEIVPPGAAVTVSVLKNGPSRANEAWRNLVWIARTRRLTAHGELKTRNGSAFVLLERIQNLAEVMGLN